MTKLKVVLDVGHSAQKGGAYNPDYGIDEFDFWLPRSHKVSDHLRAAGLEVQIVNRLEAGGHGAVAATNACNKANGDLIVALHANAFNGMVSGSEVLAWHSSKKANKLAESILAAMVNVLGLNNRGVQAIRWPDERGYHQLRYTKAPCVIIEPFFMDNTGDLRVAMAKELELCKAIADGIIKYVESIS